MPKPPKEHKHDRTTDVTVSRLTLMPDLGPNNALNIALMFEMTGAPTADFPVTLTATPPLPGFPRSATIPAGNASYRLTVPGPPDWATRPQGYQLTQTITATDTNGVTQTATWIFS